MTGMLMTAARLTAGLVERLGRSFSRAWIFFGGLAAGGMLSGAVWGLLIPSIASAGRGPLPAWLLPSAGFMAGFMAVTLLPRRIPAASLTLGAVLAALAGWRELTGAYLAGALICTAAAVILPALHKRRSPLTAPGAMIGFAAIMCLMLQA